MRNNKSRFNINDTVIIKITRYGFVAGEALTVVDPNKKGKKHSIVVTARNKTKSVPIKYLDD